jgi:hypothetical protein
LLAGLPQVLDELRSGAIHLTGLFLLAHHLTQENYEAVMIEPVAGRNGRSSN